MDKKGALFGKVNIIDGAFIVLILCVFIALYPKMLTLYSLEIVPYVQSIKKSMNADIQHAPPTVPPVQVQENRVVEAPVNYENLPVKEMCIKVRFSGYSAEVVRAIKDRDPDENIPTTWVMDVVSTEPMLATNAQGVRYRDPNLKTAVVRIHAMVSYDNERLFYNNEPLKLGWHFLLKTSMYNVNGEVIQIDPYTRSQE
ncbi:MAG TPA: DUF4330 family protein [Candidatus Omnitrophota bacterium]|nr:DUF4330 family protein [Candidatus Omnitrophota bacterium]